MAKEAVPVFRFWTPGAGFMVMLKTGRLFLPGVVLLTPSGLDLPPGGICKVVEGIWEE